MPDKIDISIGSQLRARRVAMGFSQGALGEKVGLSFQQIQKYEKGTNRVSASNLYRLSQILGVSIGYFFEGIGGAPEQTMRVTSHRTAALIEQLEPRRRNAVGRFIRALAQEEPVDAAGTPVQDHRHR